MLTIAPRLVLLRKTVLQAAEKDGSVKTDRKVKADEVAPDSTKKGKAKKGAKATPKSTRSTRSKAAKDATEEEEPEVCSLPECLKTADEFLLQQVASLTQPHCQTHH